MTATSLIDIINSGNRTEDDFEKAFDILFRRDGNVTSVAKYQEVRGSLPSLLDNLSMLSKSRLFSCEFCPFMFKMHYVAGVETEGNERMRLGKNLHLVNCQFWKSAKPNEILEWSNGDLRKSILKRYLSFVPPEELTPEIYELSGKFAQFESERMTAIYNMHGQSMDVTRELILPLSVELPVENYGNNLMGIIDRVDRTDNGALCVVEYKYGKPKYVLNSYDRPRIMHELCFYDLLMEGDMVYVVKDEKTAVPVEDVLGLKPRFYYGAMLFFRDMDGTNGIVKLGNTARTNVRKLIDAYWEMLAAGNFQPSPKYNYCQDKCEFYWDLCELNPGWLEVENVMDG
jgi:hypothetical protein